MNFYLEYPVSGGMFFVMLWNKEVIKGIEVYFTDRKLKTFAAIEESTHKGYKITVDSDGIYMYELEVSLFSNYDPRDPEACMEYGEKE